MIRRFLNGGLILPVLCMLLLGPSLPATAVTKSFRQNNPGDNAPLERAIEKGFSEKRGDSAADNPLAVFKEGFYRGVSDNRITIQDTGNYREASYRLEENYRVFYEDQELPLEHVPPDSIVRLIVIEGQVREIVLLQRSS